MQSGYPELGHTCPRRIRERRVPTPWRLAWPSGRPRGASHLSRRRLRGVILRQNKLESIRYHYIGLPSRSRDMHRVLKFVRRGEKF